MHDFVAGADRPRLQEILLAVSAGYESSGLANQQGPGRNVPGLDAPLPEGVEPTRGHIGKIKRGAAHPPHIDDLGHDGGQLGFESRMLSSLAEMRNAAADQRLRKLAALRDPKATIVAEGALAFFSHVHFVGRGIVDHARDDLALALERDRNREHRYGVQKVGRRIERINMPGVSLVRALDPSALLHDEAIAWPRLGELLVKRFLRAL